MKYCDHEKALCVLSKQQINNCNIDNNINNNKITKIKTTKKNKNNKYKHHSNTALLSDLLNCFFAKCLFY